MAEEKKKTTSKRKTTSKITLDKNELSEIITNALLEYDKTKEEQKEQEYYGDKTTQGVGFKMFWKMLWNPKKYVKTKDANTLIVKHIITTIYNVFEVILYFFSALFLVASMSWLLPSLNQKIPVWTYIVYGCAAIVSLLIARVVKIMSIDVERNKDNNFLISLLALIISLVSMIIAIIALK